MSVVPTPQGDTSPSLSTVAIDSSSLYHLTFCIVASVGETIAVSFAVIGLSAYNVISLCDIATPSTPLTTLTFNFDNAFPHLISMNVSPILSVGVTTPFSSTAAIVISSDLYVIFLFVVFSGITSAAILYGSFSLPT